MSPELYIGDAIDVDPLRATATPVFRLVADELVLAAVAAAARNSDRLAMTLVVPTWARLPIVVSAALRTPDFASWNNFGESAKEM